MECPDIAQCGVTRYGVTERAEGHATRLSMCDSHRPNAEQEEPDTKEDVCLCTQRSKVGFYIALFHLPNFCVAIIFIIVYSNSMYVPKPTISVTIIYIFYGFKEVERKRKLSVYL